MDNEVPRKNVSLWNLSGVQKVQVSNSRPDLILLSSLSSQCFFFPIEMSCL